MEKININTLLSNIDMEEMKILSENNKNVNIALMGLIRRWEEIQRLEVDKKWSLNINFKLYISI